MWFLRQQCLPGRSCSTSRLDSIMPEALRGCGIGLFEALGEVFQGSRVPSLEDPAPDLLSFLAAVRHLEASGQHVEGLQIPRLGHVG